VLHRWLESQVASAQVSVPGGDVHWLIGSQRLSRRCQDSLREKCQQQEHGHPGVVRSVEREAWSVGRFQFSTSTDFRISLSLGAPFSSTVGNRCSVSNQYTPACIE
jgi:hypothetical protein